MLVHICLSKKGPLILISKVLNCNIILSSNSSRAITFTFGLIHTEKVLTLLSSQL